MDEFANILHRDYGLKPQGKSAPMASSAKSSAPSPFSSLSPKSTPSSIYRTSSAPKQKTGPSRNNRSSNSILGESVDDDVLFGSSNGFSATYRSPFSDTPGTYDDVFGGPPRFTTPSYPPMPSSTSQQSSSSQSYDDIFRMPAKSSSSNSSSFAKGSSFPVFDAAPLYDDDIFGGVQGIRNAGVVYDDVFSGTSNVGTSPNVLEDLLGMSESKDRSSGSQQHVSDSSTTSAGPSAFDDLLPGFGVTGAAKPTTTGAEKSGESPHDGLDKNSFGRPPSDPFDGIHIDDPLNVQQFAGSASDIAESSSEPVKGSAQSSSSHHKQHASRDDTHRDSSPHLFKAHSPPLEKSHPSRGQTPSPTTALPYMLFVERDSVSRTVPNSNGTAESKRDSSSPSPTEQSEAPTIQSPSSNKGRQVYDDVEEPVHLPKAVESRPADEYWISVEDVKLVTEPTAMPPPSRRPPVPVMKHGQSRRRAPGARAESSFKGPSSRHESPHSSKLSSSIEAPDTGKKSTVNAPSNTYEELEQFASGVSRSRKDTKMDMSPPTLNEDILEGSAAVSASSMAMKEAMERARSKLWERGKEQRESSARTEGIQEGGNEAKEEDEVNKVGGALEERQRVREREEKEREAKALREERDRRRREREKEKENEREREREREREKDRIAFERAAVERANAEARERLAAEVRQRAAAERAAAEAREQAAAAEARERVAVEKVTAEARERAGAEARERAAAEAREKAAAERAAAEARERAAAEARERVAAERAGSEARARAERAFVERVHAEARERAAEKAVAEARERAATERAAAEARERAAAAREQHRRSENDLEAFFAASSRPASAPRQRSPVKGTSADGRQVNKTEAPQRASTAASGARKVTATTSNDDFTSLFGPAVPPAGEFQEVDGESADRRKARWERHQRTAERAAKALDEKNQRDLQSQREQAERHRAGEVVDAEIKRWAAGKEGNLRALLSTLQYVLWPESGWQAVSLTDLITAAAVKKVYRKATLFVHPDKVQQKGATIHQKYIAEKVFDLLKEAWNKFNSEELF